MPRSFVRIGRAAAGLGLFAAQPIARKAYIVTYRGKRIATAEAQRRERRHGAKYMFEVNRRWTIDGTSRRNLGRYVNHSCRPNADAVLRKGRIVFVALRDIAPGEEITFDYGEEYFALFIAGAGCRCTACHRTAPPPAANGAGPLEPPGSACPRSTCARRCGRAGSSDGAGARHERSEPAESTRRSGRGA